VIYRPDIDGLRAIAVCIVIFFHFGIPGFSGGFIGVDVFFVLSGYLIGSIILHQLKNNKFSFTRFYFRRVRRLFPVFAVVLIVTTIAAYRLMLPNDFREYGQSVIASSVYLSNILFYMEAGYFDTASHLKPLLHTWSLSVEEQFYIVFPILAWLIYLIKKNWIFPLFLSFTCLSLIAAEWYLSTNASAVFYLYPFRAWEMFIGVCLATQALPKIRSPRMNGLAALSGLTMILAPNFIYTSATSFPGLSALIPCLGTCLLIHTGGHHKPFAHRLLTTIPAVFIGKISYSLYLWHWPVFVLYMYDKNNEPAVIDIILMMIMTVVAAILSWKYIETPFREGKALFSKTPFSVFAATAVTSIALIGVGYVFHTSKGLPSRFDAQTAKFANAANDLFGDFSGCHGIDNKQLKDIEYCILGDPFNSNNYTLIWGDSHGGAYKRGLEQAITKNGHSAILAWTGGCPPVFGIDKDESASSRAIDALCTKRNKAIQKLITSDKRINAVVLVGRWSYYLNGQGVGVDKENSITLWPEDGKKGDVNNQSDFFVDKLKQTISELSAANHGVFVVEQTPEFSQYKARIVALGLINGNIDKDFESLTTEDYKQVLQRQQKIQDVIEAEDSKGIITVLKTHHFFCNESQCSLVIDGEPLYFDNNHLSSTGSLKVNSMFQPLIRYLDKKAKR
jgi:peptidoglycan/LPS O-acetylase OafA/YrhL